ncbi:MAG: CPBP family intramembrane metalloprotease, partial [Christensenellaceae bacterium]|nr:CPBP family intramembrane metalloprotease [Christensenellaceae bacterium]
MDQLMPPLQPSSPTRFFSRVGLCFSLLVVLSTLFATLLAVLALFFPALANSPFMLMFSSLAPIHLMAMPLCRPVLKKAPRQKSEPRALGAYSGFILFLMAIGLMQVGALLGNTVGPAFDALLGREAANPVVDMLSQSTPWVSLILISLLAPLAEELIFRKFLMDRLLPYGERAAVLISGVTFGLFHGNFYQMFYATLLGLLLAFLYVKTGRMRYPVILHMAINFLGGVIAPLLLSLGDSGLVWSLIYSCVYFALGICGIVLLIAERKKFRLQPHP